MTDIVKGKVGAVGVALDDEAAKAEARRMAERAAAERLKRLRTLNFEIIALEKTVHQYEKLKSDLSTLIASLGDLNSKLTQTSTALIAAVIIDNVPLGKGSLKTGAAQATNCAKELSSHLGMIDVEIRKLNDQIVAIRAEISRISWGGR